MMLAVLAVSGFTAADFVLLAVAVPGHASTLISVRARGVMED
jgi:hypothetical protein